MRREMKERGEEKAEPFAICERLHVIPLKICGLLSGNYFPIMLYFRIN